MSILSSKARDRNRVLPSARAKEVDEGFSTVVVSCPKSQLIAVRCPRFHLATRCDAHGIGSLREMVGPLGFEPRTKGL